MTTAESASPSHVNSTAAGVQVGDVSKAYPGVQAIDHVSIAIHPGEIVGLVGHNGAGKSTLTRILAGVEQPDSGTIHIHGRAVRLGTVRDALSQGVALVPQQSMVVPNLSVAENLTLGVAGNGGRDRLEELARDLGLSVYLGLRADRLGPALQRLLTIGRALLWSPQIMILDEPTAAFSRPEVDRLFSILLSMRSKGIGVLYITHRLEEVLELTDRVVVMREGRVVHEAATSAFTRESLTDAIVGRHTEMVQGRSERRAERRELLRCTELVRRPRVRGVSFALYRGEVLGLTGLVGSGRTSLLRVLNGIDPADSGEVFIDGKLVKLSSPAKAIREGIAYLPEDRIHNAVIPEMLVAENVTLPIVGSMRYSRAVPLLSLRKEQTTVAPLLDRLQVQPPRSERRKIKFLSGGNQQKTVLARWLLTGARIFIFDEPTEGIDVGARQEVYALIRQFAKQGKGVIVSSSDIREVTTLADRVIVMRAGRVAATLEGDQVSEGTIKHACLTDV